MTALASVLDEKVLVLNRLYTAVRVISARRAFIMLCKRAAEVISVEDNRYSSHDFDSWLEISELHRAFEPDAHDWIRTVRFDVAVPRIIRLLIYDKLPRQEVKLNRRNIFARDHNRCQYCGRKSPSQELSIDHVVPRSHGGKTSWTNVACCCVRCNVRKGGRTPAQARMKLICPPVKPRRSPVININLSNDKYASWKQFLDHAYWSVELK